MACNKKTIESVLVAMRDMDGDVSPYQISLKTGMAHTTIQRALFELEKSGKVKQVTDGVGQVYPRWFIIEGTV